MLIKAIEVGYLQTNCYVVADEATLDAVTAGFDRAESGAHPVAGYMERTVLADLAAKKLLGRLRPGARVVIRTGGADVVS